MPSDFRLGKYRGKYAVVWTEHGETRRRSLRTTDRARATEAFAAFLREAEKASRPEIVTVEFVWGEYQKALGAKPAATTMAFEWKAIGPHFGGMSATAIREDDCKRYIARRCALGRSDGTIGTELGRLRSALSWAARQDIIAKAPHIVRPPRPAPRDKRMTREQVAKFIATCTMPHIKLFCRLAIATGGRMGAILGLTWDRVDLKGGKIRLDDPERGQTNKRRATVPIEGKVVADLKEAQQAATSRYVIEWGGKKVATVKKGLAKVGRDCGMPWVTAHVFRHSAACIMAEEGLPMAEIAQFLGHTDSRITEQVYARYSPEHLRKAAKVLDI